MNRLSFILFDFKHKKTPMEFVVNLYLKGAHIYNEFWRVNNEMKIKAILFSPPWLFILEIPVWKCLI